MIDEPGILALWNDCATERETDYERWYMADHLPERVGTPGFRFGRRYLRLEGDRKYFTFYETDSPSVLWSPDYLARLQEPTAWTRRVMPSFRNTIRTVCRKAASFGSALGGHVVTFRVVGEGPPGAELESAIRAEILPDLLRRDGACHAHLWIATGQQTPARTAETDIRGADEMLSWALIVETTSDESSRTLATDPPLRQRLAALTSAGEVVIGRYRLICIRSRDMLVAHGGA